MLLEYQQLDCTEIPAWLSALGQMDVEWAIEIEEREAHENDLRD